MTSCLRFLVDNYADLSILAASSISSEDASFPDENIYDIYRRNKVWRSAGFWDLSLNDKTIVFRESVGVDLTATIVGTSFSTDSSFLTAIKTALDLIGDSTYTVSRDSTTKKIKILSNGLGGGGVFQLRMADAASLEMGAILGFDAVNLTGALTYTADELKIHTNEFIKWDMGFMSNPKAFVLAGPRNTPLKFSQNAVLKLQGNQTDNFASPSFSQTLTMDDYVIFSQNTSGLHTSGLRYWRLNIEDASNPNIYVEIGLIYLGDSTSFVRGSAQFGMTTQYIDRSTTVFAESGAEFTDIRPKADKISLDIAGLTKADLEQFDMYFQRYGLEKPFWISLDSDAAFSSSANRWVKNVKFDTAPSHQLRSPNNFSARVELREQL